MNYLEKVKNIIEKSRTYYTPKILIKKISKK
jgi:hypothetical protein